MPRKCVCVALVAIFALAASRSAPAQVTVDVTKVNCDQFVHHKISEPRLIAAWLSGYYNAKRNNRVIDLQTLEENMSKVTNYCSDEKNFKVPVMKAVGQVLEPIREVWIHDEEFAAASRLSMMRIMAKRTNAATVVA